MKAPVYIALLSFAAAIVFGVQPLYAQSGADSVPNIINSPVAIAIHITGPVLAYGDLIDFDQKANIYLLSQYADDPRVYGVAVKDAPVVLLGVPSDVPVLRAGEVLLNVTLENGPITAGDGIISSSIAGKGMRASDSSKNIVGIARESFNANQSSTTLTLGSKSIPAGTILVDIGGNLRNVTATTTAGAIQKDGCTAGTFGCSLLQKVDAAPLVTLMRYLIAATVALGSLYLAFRSFMADAVNGVISVGRNPRAKTAIQAMVIFNAILAGGIALAGLAVAMLILVIQI